MSPRTYSPSPAGRQQLTLLEMISESVVGDPPCSIQKDQTRMSLGKPRLRTAKTSPRVRRTARKDKLFFRLYITQGEKASARALANLTTICREHFSRRYEIEIVDARKHPRRAERDEVTTTPTLIKRFPAPVWTIVGDLSEDALILAAMKRK